MFPRKPKPIDMVHMNEDYPDTGIALLCGHDYEGLHPVCKSDTSSCWLAALFFYLSI